MKLDPDALEKAAETHWLAINFGSRSPWAEVDEPIREEIRALIRADVAAYLDALVASGRARYDDEFAPGVPYLVIRLDGDTK